MMKDKPIVCLGIVLLFALGIFLRLHELGAAAFGADNMEFYKLALRNQDIVEFWKNPPWLNQIPLNETFSLLLVKAGLPATPFVVRLPFALMGILTLFFVWQFARKRMGETSALAVLFLAVFNPYQIYFSRTAYHYSGAICWSAAMFCVFWSIKETLQKKQCPAVKPVVLWFVTAALACHMHMSVWVVAGLQGVLLLVYGWLYLRSDKQSLRRFAAMLVPGAVAVGVLLSRWAMRALQRLSEASSGGKQLIGADAGSEFKRLLPACFAGETAVAVLLIACFAAAIVPALVKSSENRSFLGSWGSFFVLNLLAVMAYIALVGGGVAKISYFSAVWPMFIILIGGGAELGIRAVCGERRIPRMALRVLLFGGYLAFALPASWAIVNLDGKPKPYYKINAWIQQNLPAGTPVLVDRWLAPWNELAVHNPGNINYTFTVPDAPLANYQRNNWRATAEQFFENYPQAALLEVRRGRFDASMGPWEFPKTHFANHAAITNDAAMTLRRLNVFPTRAYSDPDAKGIVVYISWNTPADLIADARSEGREVLRLYGAGWGVAKPGWQRGDFSDYRTMTRSASVILHNLTGQPLTGSLKISAASAQRPKTVSIAGATVVFPAGRLTARSIPLTLQPGSNRIKINSPSNDPLFVRDLEWRK